MSELKVGDVIEVRRIKIFEGDIWIPARVIRIEPYKIEVQCLKGTFDGTHDLEALPTNQQAGRFWRR
jgi:hypothetical protein